MEEMLSSWESEHLLTLTDSHWKRIHLERSGREDLLTMEPIVPSIQEFSPLIAFLKVKVTSPCQKFFADITLSDGRGSDWETLVSDEKAPGVLRWFGRVAPF